VSPDERAALIARAAKHHLAVVEKAAAGVDCECLTVTGHFPAEAIVATAMRRKRDLIYRRFAPKRCGPSARLAEHAAEFDSCQGFGRCSQGDGVRCPETAGLVVISGQSYCKQIVTICTLRELHCRGNASMPCSGPSHIATP
jgi:hypothetical protein